jgi:hypothetical protein
VFEVFQKLGANALHIRSKGELADRGAGAKTVPLRRKCCIARQDC